MLIILTILSLSENLKASQNRTDSNDINTFQIRDKNFSYHKEAKIIS